MLIMHAWLFLLFNVQKLLILWFRTANDWLGRVWADPVFIALEFNIPGLESALSRQGVQLLGG
jgi:hypothetical protein